MTALLMNLGKWVPLSEYHPHTFTPPTNYPYYPCGKGADATCVRAGYGTYEAPKCGGGIGVGAGLCGFDVL